MQYQFNNEATADKGNSWHEYDPKVEKRLCFACGHVRPADWFVPGSTRCWKCRALHIGEDWDYGAVGGDSK